MSAKNIWIAFGLGAATGAAVALLYAPQSGERTRKKLGRAYDEAQDYIEDAGDYLKDQADRTAKKSKKLYGKGVEAASDAFGSAADAYGKASDKVSDSFATAKDKAGEIANYTAAYSKKVRSMV